MQLNNFIKQIKIYIIIKIKIINNLKTRNKAKKNFRTVKKVVKAKDIKIITIIFSQIKIIKNWIFFKIM